MKYNNKRTKIKISNSLQRESPQEIKQSMVRIDDDRKLLLNAAIVRIMKCRQTLKHNELIQQVSSNIFNLFIFNRKHTHFSTYVDKIFY